VEIRELGGHDWLTLLKCQGKMDMSWPQAAEYNMITNKPMVVEALK
jgi:hypothetical protein